MAEPAENPPGPIQLLVQQDTWAGTDARCETQTMGLPPQDAADVMCEFPVLASPPPQLPRDTRVEGRSSLPATPSRQTVAGGLQYGSPWRTGPATPLSAQLWRTIAPELTPGGDSNGYGPPRIHITVPERLGADRCVRFDHGGTTYSVNIPPDYSPGSRVEVELTAPLSRGCPPPPMMDNAMSPRRFGSPVMMNRRSLESPVMVVENETMSVLRIKHDVSRFREDLRANNAVKDHLRHQLELLEEESQLIDACLTSKAEIKRLSDELKESQDQVREKKEKAMASSPTKSTPSSRPEATGQGEQSISPVLSGLDQVVCDSLEAIGEQEFLQQDPAGLNQTMHLGSPEEETMATILQQQSSLDGTAAMDQAEPEPAASAPLSSARTRSVSPSMAPITNSIASKKLPPPVEANLTLSPRTSARRAISPVPVLQGPTSPVTLADGASATAPPGASFTAPGAVSLLKPGPARATPRSVTREVLTGGPPIPMVLAPVPLGSRPSLPTNGTAGNTLQLPQSLSLSAVPPPKTTPRMFPRSLGSGATASLAFAPSTRQPSEAVKIPMKETAMLPQRVAPMVVQRGDAPPSESLLRNPLVRQKSEAPTVASRLTVMSPRLTTRGDLGNPEAVVCPVAGPQQGIHPARSTLQICRPSPGKSTVRPIVGGMEDMSMRVRTSSPGFRRDQSYRTTLPASLPNRPVDTASSLRDAFSQRSGLNLGPPKNTANRAGARSLPRHPGA